MDSFVDTTQPKSTTNEKTVWLDYSPSFVVWLTGLPSSGKTTISGMLKLKLKQQFNLNLETLDGDVVRRELSPDLGFTKQDRDLHAKRVVYLCKLLLRNRVPTVVSLISPYRDFRAFARKEIGNFVEVYVRCSLETCINRDVKGLYKKALEGKITDLTGLQDPYEEPLNPEIMVNTEAESLDEIVDRINLKLRDLGYLQRERFE
jgi:adenylylsulfate kinase